jgi:rhodanese-related sulfurtransferase
MPETITVQDLAARINAGGIDLVDVREVHEFVAGHVPGARSIPMSILPVRVNEIPKGSEVHVICQSGARSMQVAIWLANQGYSVVNVAGGTGTWVMAGGPVETGMAA